MLDTDIYFLEMHHLGFIAEICPMSQQYEANFHFIVFWSAQYLAHIFSGLV